MQETLSLCYVDEMKHLNCGEELQSGIRNIQFNLLQTPAQKLESSNVALSAAPE